ncbi:4-hydroxy-3-methylbut-2-enyl diphosphate reductase [hydrothermal vent metagenome]|uniref:4-hydroxy-3-methylbut-2-enyl diphosphate reductase n=1 Tax=hydrothermal vent metagenome TaxID=652676 RepID=A0A3B1B7G9_9ZZZZ
MLHGPIPEHKCKMNSDSIKVTLANPRGFCAGVDRAIEIVERALELFEHPVYVRHEVVHNRYVVQHLNENGAVFVNELNEVPDGATVIFSAHGVPKAVYEEAQQRGLKVFDATCPLVTKVHMEVLRYSKAEYDCILIGHAGHPEVEGTMGQFDASFGKQIYLVENIDDVQTLEIHDPIRLAYVSQTTLSLDDTAEIIDALRKRFPEISGPKKNDICYATQNRQDAVKQLAAQCDLVLVVGSPNSSNSNRLREVAERLNVPAYLIDNETEIKRDWLKGKKSIGLSAGASAPEVLVNNVIARLKEWGVSAVVQDMGSEENVVFSLPQDLKKTIDK